MLIVLDNGHGWNTPGKRSPVWSDGTQVYEWEYTRKLAKEIRLRLNAIGIPCILLVPENEDISLGERVRRVNNIYKERKDIILISLHCNAGGGTGWEAWTSVGETKSDYYAKLLYNSAGNYLKGWRIRTDYSDGDPDWESQFYILKNTWCPAILTENMFMDNEKDCKFMMSAEGLETLAALHVDAIVTLYYENN